MKPLDFSKDYHNTTLSEVKTLEIALSHSQAFSIIWGKKWVLKLFWNFWSKSCKELLSKNADKRR
jgi:hypothetical protein